MDCLRNYRSSHPSNPIALAHPLAWRILRMRGRCVLSPACAGQSQGVWWVVLSGGLFMGEGELVPYMRVSDTTRNCGWCRRRGGMTEV
jgi:hypothetical protein